MPKYCRVKRESIGLTGKTWYRLEPQQEHESKHGRKSSIHWRCCNSLVNVQTSIINQILQKLISVNVIKLNQCCKDNADDVIHKDLVPKLPSLHILFMHIWLDHGLDLCWWIFPFQSNRFSQRYSQEAKVKMAYLASHAWNGNWLIYQTWVKQAPVIRTVFAVVKIMSLNQQTPWHRFKTIWAQLL